MRRSGTGSRGMQVNSCGSLRWLNKFPSSDEQRYRNKIRWDGKGLPKRGNELAIHPTHIYISTTGRSHNSHEQRVSALHVANDPLAPRTPVDQYSAGQLGP